MASAGAWADAYLAQAAEDLAAAERIGGVAPSVLAMLLQMAFEKTAKAALLRSSQMTVAKAQATHCAASRMVQVLKRNRALLAALGHGDRFAWRDVLPLVTELERAHPALASSGPHLEYPWEDAATGEVWWPARDLPVARRLGAPDGLVGARTLKFAKRLLQAFDAVFPP